MKFLLVQPQIESMRRGSFWNNFFKMNNLTANVLAAYIPNGFELEVFEGKPLKQCYNL